MAVPAMNKSSMGNQNSGTGGTMGTPTTQTGTGLGERPGKSNNPGSTPE
jgi:hypothetical protein